MKNVDISVTAGFRRVYIQFSLPISDEAHPELIEALEENLSTLNGVNAVDLYRYEVVLLVATHVRKAIEVAFDVFEIVFEPDGDVVGALLSAFDGYNLKENL